MGTYRVYRVGEQEPVREARGVAAKPLKRRDASPEAPASGLRPLLVWAAIAAACAVAAVLLWLYGRDLFGNSQAAFDLAKLSGKVPGWAFVGVPLAAAVIVAIAAVYLAFGRYLAVKLIGVAVVVVVLAAPGLALGWANGTVNVVSHRSAAVQKVVKQTTKELGVALPGKPQNILLIGSDKSTTPGDTGRSDTQILVRLDPETKSISMLSLPRDLRVDIPGVGYDKMNAAYAYGGPALVVKTFKQITGLPVNHFVEINFAGFWHVVNILGGVYIPVDHKYFVPASADYKSINLDAGYQLVRGKQALNFVRFRHDQLGDFTRMQRQQLFLKELQRQSGRWSGDWSKVLKLIKAITGETTSDIDTLKRLEPLVQLVFQVDTSKINTVHLEGDTPMINGVSYVTATQEQIDQAVSEFTNPVQAPVRDTTPKISRKLYKVTVYNGSGIAGMSTTAANQLVAQGYNADVGPDDASFPGTTTVVYAARPLATPAKAIAAMVSPSRVELVDRAPGVIDGISVFVTSSFDGTIILPQTAAQQPQQVLEKNVRNDAASWKALAKETPLRLEMPTAWPSGSVYNEFRKYGIPDLDGKSTRAAVAVASTPQGGYWSVQAMRWTDPPAIKDPSDVQTIKGRRYMLFYQGENLHMVAWKSNGTLYWVLNTLDNQLSNDVMLGLATSCKPVK
jgi:LCP family protein required for cell wall assembly